MKSMSKSKRITRRRSECVQRRLELLVKYSFTSKYPATVALDVLQSKNAVAQVILLSYHSLTLVKVTT